MTVSLDGESLTPEDVVTVAREDVPVTVPDSARERVRESRQRVERVLESEEPVYGINTGFGELVDERIPPEDLQRLQHNLLCSHATGAGRELAREAVRATMVARINALVTGYSGVREAVIDHLVGCCNEGVHPVVKSRGSLGASGDLAPLAHMALVLVGEGEAIVETDAQERRLSGDEALAEIGLEPLSLAPKEGLALINGTQLTVGLASLAVVDAERLVRAADAAGALTTETTLATTATADSAIHDVRPHTGQQESAAFVRRLTADSEVVEAHRNCDRVQDAYSLRCLPQVHGAVRDAVAHLREGVEIELNSATDNPLVFAADRVDERASGTDNAAVLSGGNFHGAPLALRLEYVRLALADLAAISERRIDRMLNPNIQEPHLPPFLAVDSGVESGYMIAQYTAASLLNEIRALGAASTDNVPVSGGQEDHVSMSAQSALQVQTALENATWVVAAELCCGAEAAEYVDTASDIEPGPLTLGSGTEAVCDLVRDVVPPLSETGDRPLHDDIGRVVDLIEAGLLEEQLVATLERDDEDRSA
ncbi:histidine ammonia-lyase [Natronobacterium gregoryi]|uniref:Histidine ammonia-lyase n=2 Tax=Natronobacterium gregoryi TaxID=44930 RepID=L0ABZ8_NATGS|nr:histidine ammonia-lyase [Natronobacterium gregoryi]AFZ71391.1 histidine ammonia-lyase [Natronobacterium gregoryi SP2]ELY66916.1 histidine ammonia-lyase [Natronobacterium gregoryi SP2]PLK21230.1 histidine ammonia-lyase [Natronobacterium gregoryi SP2]SFI84783.1 histidine ammonia-lyase [Natronobacterium gregoryi]